MKENNLSEELSDKILSILSEFESFRKKILWQYLIAIMVFSSLIIYLSHSIFFNHQENLKNVIIHLRNTNSYLYSDNLPLLNVKIICLLLAVIMYLIAKHIKNKFRKITKENFYTKIFKMYNLEYFPFNQLDQSIIDNSKLLPNYDLYHGSDYIYGSYKSINIELGQIKLVNFVEESSGETTKIIKKEIFHGIFLISELNKKFSSTIYIVPEQIIQLRFKIPEKLQRIKLEDPIFEKNFDVYADNQVESRYIITPTFMERLVKLNENNKLSCVLQNNLIYMSIHSQNEFLPYLSLFRKAKFGDILKLTENLSSVFNIIDVLKLDQKIGM